MKLGDDIISPKLTPVSCLLTPGLWVEAEQKLYVNLESLWFGTVTAQKAGHERFG